MSEMEPEPALLAIDLGGTRVKISRFAPDGTREETSGGDTASQTSAEDLVRLLRSVSVQLLEGRQLRGVGIGVAGVLDPVAGRIVQSPNLPYMDGFPLREKLESELGAPVTMMNDANAAALGEYFAGAPGASGSMFLLTLGTGVGGAFVQDGRIWEGAAGMAGEVGHMCIMVGGPGCHCGGKGCLEALCSGWALVRDAKKPRRREKILRHRGPRPHHPRVARRPRRIGRCGRARALGTGGDDAWHGHGELDEPFESGLPCPGRRSRQGGRPPAGAGAAILGASRIRAGLDLDRGAFQRLGRVGRGPGSDSALFGSRHLIERSGE